MLSLGVFFFFFFFFVFYFFFFFFFFVFCFCVVESDENAGMVSFEVGSEVLALLENHHQVVPP